MCCAKEKTSYKTAMNWRCWAIALIASSLLGCGFGRAVTAPVRHVFGEPEPAATTNASDVTNPGQPVAIPSPTATPKVASRKSKQTSASASSRVAASKPSAKPSPSSQKPASATQFPVAKPVPGRPGLVFNPFNTSGGYIDVSGYAPGSKVKDPDSKQIFVVP
jgi:LysM repeat protein